MYQFSLIHNLTLQFFRNESLPHQLNEQKLLEEMIYLNFHLIQ